MLRNRVSIELGTRSILYLYLAFAFNVKASNATFKELGCEFVDNEYKMERKAIATSPIWSEEGIDSMELPMDPEDSYWQPIVDYLSEVSIMNDVSPLAKFVKTYKSNPNGTVSFESFFDNYNVPFKLNETKDPASYIIQMFHKLRDNHQNQPNQPVLEYYYLVSASVDPSDEDISTAMSADGSDAEYVNRTKLVRKMLDVTRFQDHFAGIMKITSGNRTGYILVDPGYANGEKLVHPFVAFLTGDGLYPDGVMMNGFTSYENYNVQFTYYPNRLTLVPVPFILAEHVNSNTMTKVLYYIGKPYCSFIENTIKPNLLRLNHGIITRDSNNQKQRYLRFKISPDDNSLILQKVDNSTTGIMKEDNAPITDFTRPLNERVILSPIQMELGVSKEEATMITKELNYIQTEVFNNNGFMSKIINLSKKLDLYKAPRQYSPTEFKKFIEEDDEEKEEELVKQPSRLSSKLHKSLSRSLSDKMEKSMSDRSVSSKLRRSMSKKTSQRIQRLHSGV